ncbi:rhamnosyltransferase [Arthrobacter sp. B2I5]|uniref:glycosyltransferase n=1 Tax=Arthrobacter sp. B2I5 TaxID=3042266 RepID=UPI002785726D|nr:glycosyltransferase [Arthrobacter sp. B2I5]MDQ0825144.1 rhamnosyltransferase [Arthrobacter sp. B2I5]
MTNARKDPAIIAVVSAFNPPYDLVDRVRGLSKQVSHVVVVDDGSEDGDGEIWRKLEIVGAEVIHHTQNRGIAAALNTGIEAAFSFDTYGWVLTMDQDSELTGGYIENSLITYRAATAKGAKVGLVAPGTHNGYPVKMLTGSQRIPEAFDPMQSGCLIPGDVIRQAGQLDESLFIDCVDTDFNSRLRSLGYLLPVSPRSDLRHELGKKTSVRVFDREIQFRGRPLALTHHSPLRVYYITRNAIVVSIRHLRHDPVWMLRRLWMETESNLIRLVFGPSRRAYVLAWRLGIRDALRHELGKADEEILKRLR